MNTLEILIRLDELGVDAVYRDRGDINVHLLPCLCHDQGCRSKRLVVKNSRRIKKLMQKHRAEIERIRCRFPLMPADIKEVMGA